MLSRRRGGGATSRAARPRPARPGGYLPDVGDLCRPPAVAHRKANSIPLAVASSAGTTPTKQPGAQRLRYCRQRHRKAPVQAPTKFGSPPRRPPASAHHDAVALRSMKAVRPARTKGPEAAKPSQAAERGGRLERGVHCPPHLTSGRTLQSPSSIDHTCRHPGCPGRQQLAISPASSAGSPMPGRGTDAAEALRADLLANDVPRPASP